MNMLDIVRFSLHKPCLTSQDLRKPQRQQETEVPVQVSPSVKQHPAPESITHTAASLCVPRPAVWVLYPQERRHTA